VLVVEDDDGIARPLKAALQGQGYLVTRVATGREALARAGGVDAVVLDLGLPDMDGLEVCRRLRRQLPAELPILMLTARAGEMDLVVGLDAGADDYVAKPFRLAELLARLRALLRRANANEEVNEVGAIRIEPATRRAWCDGVALELTPTEFDLLTVLVRRAGSVATRDDIVREVWDTDWVGTSRTLDMHVSALRRKLGDDPSAPRHLATVRGVGFRLETDDLSPRADG
jgi:DNA-binding response OmpR family regulator